MLILPTLTPHTTALMQCLKSHPAIVQALVHCMQRWSHERELFLKISCFAVAKAHLSEPGPKGLQSCMKVLCWIQQLCKRPFFWVGKLFITSDSVNYTFSERTTRAMFSPCVDEQEAD